MVSKRRRDLDGSPFQGLDDEPSGLGRAWSEPMATEPESVYLCSKDDKHPEMGLADLACAGALDGLT